MFLAVSDVLSMEFAAKYKLGRLNDLIPLLCSRETNSIHRNANTTEKGVSRICALQALYKETLTKQYVYPMRAC